MYGGGDTLQEFKDLNPGLYLSVIDNTQYYFFTGGGTVLTAIEEGTPYRLKTIQALMENRAWAVLGKEGGGPLLDHTFIHIAGIGPKTERHLWDRGILTWEQFLSHPGPIFSTDSGCPDTHENC